MTFELKFLPGLIEFAVLHFDPWATLRGASGTVE